MKGTKSIDVEFPLVNVAHDVQKQIMEILSLIRVMNNYYHKKSEIQNQIKPYILHKFKEEVKLLESSGDWLHSIPSALLALNEDFTTKKDSFKFPDGIILFEAWMDMGFNALYPKLVLHYRFPGILKGEKTRNLFQFIFSTSRGFGFPLLFNPDFYLYDFKFKKYLEFFFKWCYTVCHRANQAIFLVSERFNIKRHHPGEFESIIISEYENNVYKGIDTLLHGYFTQEPRILGKFQSLDSVLKSISFSYSIGDHAMSINKNIVQNSLFVPLLNQELITKRYNIDFYKYINKLFKFRTHISKVIIKIQRKKKELLNQINFKKKLKFYLGFKFCEQFHLRPLPKFCDSNLSNIEFSIQLMRDLLKLIWITPLFTHTIHKPVKKELKFTKALIEEEETIDSIFHLYISYFELKKGFKFKEESIIDSIDDLRDDMAKMWLYFKERQLNFALRKLNEISLIVNDENKIKSISKYVDELIPIFSIYEILHRPLAESVYPEASPQSKKIWAFIARIFSSRLNPIGVNLMKLFNKIAFNNWSFFIYHKKFNSKAFFNFILKLPIWKHIPENLKKEILNRKSILKF